VPKPTKSRRDDSISGSDSEDDGNAGRGVDKGTDASGSDSGSDLGDETGAERRLRLAERYLENIKDEAAAHDTGFDAEEIDRDLIAERLKEDVAETKGRLYRHIATEYAFDKATMCHFRQDTQCTTSVATCPPYAYTVSKDLRLTKWQLPDPTSAPPPTTAARIIPSKKLPRPVRRRPTLLLSTRGHADKSGDRKYQHHTAAILCVAASADGRFVCTGGADWRLIVWAAKDLAPLRVFTQHRDAVTALAFRRGTNQLYSASADRTIKTWSLNELAYVETLFGHQDVVVDVAALAQERCVSVGARDRTVRLWKVVEETQLVFRGGGARGTETKKPRGGFTEGSIDRVAMVDDELFVTGADNGALSLWSLHKKKPIHTVSAAHGLEPALAPADVYSEAQLEGRQVPVGPRPRWITALAVLPYGDLVLSGSWDGCVRVWRVSPDRRRIEAVGVVGEGSREGDGLGEDGGREGTGEEGAGLVKGVVNDITMFERGDRGKDGLCIVVATGKEHRLGRWKKFDGRNGAVVFEVRRQAS
jgi:ribosomal RNA-processing protein 9